MRCDACRTRPLPLHKQYKKHRCSINNNNNAMERSSLCEILCFFLGICSNFPRTRKRLRISDTTNNLKSWWNQKFLPLNCFVRPKENSNKKSFCQLATKLTQKKSCNPRGVYYFQLVRESFASECSRNESLKVEMKHWWRKFNSKQWNKTQNNKNK